jgi:hypothetical protein
MPQGVFPATIGDLVGQWSLGRELRQDAESDERAKQQGVGVGWTDPQKQSRLADQTPDVMDVRRHRPMVACCFSKSSG